jgi:multiple sugar transport system permease protein
MVGRKWWTGYVFLIPWLVGLVWFTIGPMAVSLYYSFTDYSLLQPPMWVGTANYERMAVDTRFMASSIVTLKYVALSVPIELCVSLGLAMVLNRGIKALALYRAVFYVPSLLGGSVAIAILWRQLFGPAGLFDAGLRAFGIQIPALISNPDTALLTLVALRVWQFGAPMLIFLAALRQIPKDLLEAAEMDGAGPWRRFFSVILPLLTPIVFFNLVLQVIGSFQAFTPAYIVSGGSGGPNDSTLFYTLYLYQRAFANFQMGYGAALAWVLLVVIGLFTLANFLVSKYWVYYEDGSRA